MSPKPTVVVLAIAVCLAASPEAARAQDSRPVVTYGRARTSTAWIEVPGGKTVDVDEGIEWQGKKVYLSLLWTLVAVDAETNKALWAEDVSAFWNEITVSEVETKPGEKTWAVELRPGPGIEAGKALRRYHELTTGKLLLAKSDAPPGKAIEPLPAWSGSKTSSDRALHTVIGNAADWKKNVVEPYFAGLEGAPDFGAIDFSKHVALVWIAGAQPNCGGMDAAAFEDGEGILVRLHLRTFQTLGPDGGGKSLRPFGIFLLPKREPFKPIVVERNVQRLIGGPAIWKEFERFREVTRRR